MKRLLLILKYGRPARNMPPGLKFVVPVRVPPISLKDIAAARPMPKNHLPQVEGLAHMLRAMESCRACGAVPRKNLDAVSRRKTYGILSTRWPMWFAITAAHLVLIFGIVTSALWYKQSTKNETAAISKANLVLASRDQNQPFMLVAENRQPKVLGKTIVAPRADYSGSLFGTEGKATGEKIFYAFIFKKHPFANDRKISAPNAGRQLRLFAWEKVKNLPLRLGLGEIKQGFGEVIKSAPLQIKRAAQDEAQKTAGKIYALALQMHKPHGHEFPLFGGSKLQTPQIVETISIPQISLKELPKKTVKTSGRVLGETIAPVDTNTLSKLVEERLNQYLAEGKFKGEKGEKGEKGDTGPQGAAGSSLQGGGWSLGYVNTNNPGGTGNGTIGSFTYFSSDKTQINVLNVSSQLNVSGPANFTGTVSFATTTLGGIAYAWPGGDGSANQVLVTNGSGQLSWADISVAGATWSTSTNGSIYYSSGNVGIGTSNPISVLHVVGNSNEVARFTRDNTTNVNQYFSITENINGTTLLANSATSNQKPLIINVANSGGGAGAGSMYTDFQISGASVMTLKGSNVGIGTTSPQANLEVHAPTAGATPLVRISNDGTGNGYPTIELYRSSANVGTISYIPTGIPGSQGINIIDSRNDTSSGIHFGTKGVASLVNINNLGNVGIGTTGPTTLLHIAGTDNAAYSSSAVVPYATGILLQNNSATALPARGTSISFAGDNGGLTSIVAQITGLPTGSSGVNKNGALTFATKQLTVDTALIERMRIDANGNVGIGTTSPDHTLTIQSSGTSGVAFDRSTTRVAVFNFANNDFNVIPYNGANFRYGPLGSQYLNILSTGNVGIGTTSPTYQLDIQNSSSANDIRINNTQGSNKWLDMYSNSTLMGSIYRTGNHLGIQSYTGNGYLLLNPTANNVGIGTTSPIAKLDVYGNLNVATSSTSVLFANTGTSRVGIGTSTPADTLHIVTTTSFGGFTLQSTNDVGMNIKSQAGNGAELKFTTQGVHLFARANSGNLFIGNSGGTVEMIGINSSVSSPNSVVIGRQGAAQSIGNGTLLVYDATAATGVTTLNIQEGAGQGATSTLSVLANNGTTTRLTVLGTSGNVGIGTGTPLASLHVQGSGSSNMFTISSSTGAHVLTVFPSGNIGIGAVGTGNGLAPNSKLYVTYADGSANSVTNGLTLNNVAGQPGNFVGMRLGLYSGNDTSQKQFIGAVQATNGSGGTGDIVFLTITNGGSAYQQVAAADEKMRITNYGNVGIGTTAPAALLHVETSSSTMPLLKVATSTNQGIFNISSTGNVGIGTTGPSQKLDIQANIASGGFVGSQISDNGRSGANLITGVYSSGAWDIGGLWFGQATPSATNYAFESDTGGNSYFNAPTGAVYFGVANAYHMNMNANGVAINNGNTLAGTGVGLIVGSGNVGIGTTGPLSKLDVYTADGGLQLAAGSSPNIGANIYYSSGWKYGITGFGTLMTVGNTADGNIHFYTAPSGTAGAAATLTDRVTILNTGNVGIGTTSPATTLDVNGTTTMRGALLFGTDNTWDIGASGANRPRNLYLSNALSVSSITAAATVGFGGGRGGAGAGIANGADASVYATAGKSLELWADATAGRGIEILTGTGNVGVGTTTPTLGPLTMASGAYVTAGGTWTNASDRNLKENFASVTPASILEKIVNLPIAKWNYKREDASITHLGPTAQDFYASFGLGGSDTSISTIDPSGVALVGIKALDEKINSLQQTVSNLQNTGSDVDPQAPIVFKTQVYLSQDSVGQAKILAGSKRVKVTFTKPYEYQPIVTATPLDFVSGAYRIASTTAEGFTIELKYVQDEDVTFNFHAFASPEAKLTVSDGSSENIVLVVPQVAGASVGAGETVKEDVNDSPSQSNEVNPPENPAPLIDEPQGGLETVIPETSPPTVEPAVEEPIPAVEDPAPQPEPAPAEPPLTTESNN